MFIQKFVIHIHTIVSDIESKVTFESIYVSSNVIGQKHILQLSDWTKNNICNRFRVETRIFVIAFKSLIINGTLDEIRTHHRQAMLAT